MKSYRRLMVIVIMALICIWVGANIWLLGRKVPEERPYMLEVSRVANQMADMGNADFSEGQLDELVSECSYIRKISLCNTNEDMLLNTHNDYCLKNVGDSVYRFEYDENNEQNRYLLLAVNVIGTTFFALVILVLIYIYRKIILPFEKLESIPYELSKGNLAVQMPEQKEKYFGKFIWGANMLRDNIEDRRQKELNLHREKKLLLLSLTHDIKTPLSVIRLNTQALQRGLYKEEERRQEAFSAIIKKVDEIEDYVSEITKASQEDFLDLEVKVEEFYLSDVIVKISDYYKDKLSLRKTKFAVEEYDNCLLMGDENRLVEVMQNLMENAIKYGDGQEISISFDQEEGCQLVTVENTGEGLLDDELMKIFDSFFRGSNSSKQQGSGLGLYICRQLMTGMNGDIFVKQEDNHFRITLVVPMSGE